MSSSALSRFSASYGSMRSWGHAKIKIPCRSVKEKLTRYACTELKDPNCTTLERYVLLLLLIRLLRSVRCLRFFSVLFCSVSLLRFLSFGALLGTCKSKNPISVSRREINAIRMHRVGRAELQNFGRLAFAVAPHLLPFGGSPPPLFFCPPLLWLPSPLPPFLCAPGDMQKRKT